MGSKSLARAMALSAALAAIAGAASASYDWNSVVVGGGGFVDGIVFHPKVKGLMYARTDMGGAYRWNAASTSWIPITDWIGSVSDNMGILSVALDPNDGSKVYLLSGKYANAWSGEYGYLLSSTDTGKTFTQTALHLKNGGNMDGRGTGERLAVDPNKGNILLLAGSSWDTSADGTKKGTIKGAVWMSSNGGKSFDSLKTAPSGEGMFALFDPSTGAKGSATQTMYVGINKVNGGTTAGLYRSKDGGATWAAVSGTPSGLIPTSAAIVGTDLYVSFCNGIGPNGVTGGKLMRMNTANDSWTDISPTKNATYGFGTPSPDAQNPGHLIVSSVDKWTGGDDVWLTRDNGATWSSRLLEGSLDLSFAPWKSIRTPHWLASAQIDPFDSSIALFGTGYGVFRTTGLRSSKPTWAASDSNLEETAVLQMIAPPTGGAPLYTAMGDQGGFRHVRLDKAPQAVHTPDVGTTLAIDVAWNNNSFWVKAHNAANSKGTVGSYSTDSGKTWIGFASQPAGIQVPSNANNWSGGGGTRSIASNADGSVILWAAPGASGPYISTNNGATWTASKLSSGTIDVTTAVPMGDKVNPKKVYVLDLKSGILFTSSDAGANFSAGGSFLSIDGWESDNVGFVSVPGYEGTLLVAADHRWGGGGLYLSTNAGTSLSKVSNVGSATKVAVGKAAPGKAFPAVYILGNVANVYGIYRSDDSCKTWTRINDAQHQFGTIHHLAGDPNVYGRVYIGTEGRGTLYGQPSGTVTGIETTHFGSLMSTTDLSRTGSVVNSQAGNSIVLRTLQGRTVRVGEKGRLDLTGLPRGMYLATSKSAVLRVSVTD